MNTIIIPWSAGAVGIGFLSVATGARDRGFRLTTDHGNEIKREITVIKKFEGVSTITQCRRQNAAL